MIKKNSAKKKGLKYSLILVMLILLGYGQFWMRRYSAPQIFGEAIRRIPTSEKVFALTYDDGPNGHYTEKILDSLAQYNAKATFFVVGEEVGKYPETFKRIVRSGHDVGNHSWNHTRLTYKSPSFITNQIVSTDQVIRSLGYSGTIHFRSPFGHKLFILPFLLKRMNRPHILWNIELKDWKETSAELMAKRLENELNPGSIVLLHDGDAVRSNGKKASRRATVDVTQLILKRFHSQGYRFVTITELLGFKEK